MKRKLVQSEPVLLTPSPIDTSIISGSNYLSAAFDNSNLGHTTAHVVLTVNELSGVTANKMLYVYVLHETPNGWETGSTNTDPVKAAVGAIASYGSSYQHRISIPAPILRGQFKILLRNEWDGYADVLYRVETSSQELVE